MNKTLVNTITYYNCMMFHIYRTNNKALCILSCPTKRRKCEPFKIMYNSARYLRNYKLFTPF